MFYKKSLSLGFDKNAQVLVLNFETKFTIYNFIPRSGEY